MKEFVFLRALIKARSRLTVDGPVHAWPEYKWETYLK